MSQNFLRIFKVVLPLDKIYMKEKNSIRRTEKTRAEIEKYLKKIDFDGRLKRGEYFSNKEFRKVLIKNLEEYSAEKRDQDFIIELGAVFYPEVMVSTDEHDDPLMTSVCMLNDLACNYKVPKTKKGRDKVLFSVLELLKGNKQLC